jgi:Ni,Fe-hydrogenase maturation factor
LSIPPYSIVIDYVSEGDVANLVRGYIELKGKKIRFTGVAYGRFGGQNFSPQLSPATKKAIKAVVGDLARFEEDLQLRLVKGEFETRPGKDEKHGHVHLGHDEAFKS